MKIILLLIAVMLLMTGAEARYSPGLEIAEGGNITLDGGYLVDAKMGESLSFVSVGPYGWCDYVTDGTSDQVQINYAINNSTGAVMVCGTNYIDGPIYIDAISNIRLFGESPAASICLATAYKGYGLIINQTTSHMSQHIIIEDLTFEKNSTATAAQKTGSVGVFVQYINGDSQVTITDCKFQNLDTNILLGSSAYTNDGRVYVEKCMLGNYAQTGCRYGVVVSHSLVCTFRDNVITGYNTTGIYVSDVCDGLNIYNNIIISVADVFGESARPAYGISVEAPLVGGRNLNARIDGNVIEHVGTNAIKLSGYDIRGARITNNWIAGCNGHGIYFESADANSCANAIIGNVLWDDVYGTGIVVYNIASNAWGFEVVDNIISINLSNGQKGIAVDMPNGGTATIEGNTLNVVSGLGYGGWAIWTNADNACIVGNTYHGGPSNAVWASGINNAVVGNTGTGVKANASVFSIHASAEVAHNT